jgi:hypothetical protein
MRNFVAATVAATMIASSAFAATDTGPLAVGKPAGVKQAQDKDDNTVWYVVGLGFVAAGIALVASGDSNGSLAPGTVTTTTSSATTTTTKAATTST